MDIRIDSILKLNQLSITGSRKKILDLFLNSPGALSHGDIEGKAGNQFDRVTVYRTLQTFLVKGIIHTIPTVDNAIYYALCKEKCYSGHHEDNHVHFICQSCGHTVCLEGVLIPTVRLPKNFTVSSVEMQVSGICESCKQKAPM
jgi:Fur family transcriptional regulator, ferric uptake regulator